MELTHKLDLYAHAEHEMYFWQEYEIKGRDACQLHSYI